MTIKVTKGQINNGTISQNMSQVVLFMRKVSLVNEAVHDFLIVVLT